MGPPCIILCREIWHGTPRITKPEEDIAHALKRLKN